MPTFGYMDDDSVRKSVDAFEQEMNLMYGHETMPQRQFVVVNGEGFVRLHTEKEISYMFDMENDEEVQVFTWIDEAFHPVTSRGFIKINTDEEMPFRYGRSELVANGKVVGFMTHTDH